MCMLPLVGAASLLWQVCPRGFEFVPALILYYSVTPFSVFIFQRMSLEMAESFQMNSASLWMSGNLQKNVTKCPMLVSELGAEDLLAQVMCPGFGSWEFRSRRPSPRWRFCRSRPRWLSSPCFSRSWSIMLVSDSVHSLPATSCARDSSLGLVWMG